MTGKHVQMPAKTRQKIIDSATELFLASSYGDVGVQVICDHAGVKKGSFYHYFKSKTDLAIEVIRQQCQSFEETVGAACFLSGLPPLQRFDCFLDRLFEVAQANRDDPGHVKGCPLGNLAAELSTQEEGIRQELGNAFHQLKGIFKMTLDDAVTAGDLPADMDTDVRADALLAFLEGMLLLAKAHNDPHIIRRLAPEMKKLLL